MVAVSQYLRIAACWLLSFFRSPWEPGHYPIATREQSGVPPGSTWFAYVLNWPGPSGLGATEQEAKEALVKVLREITATRWSNGQAMPRPGTGLPIEFASAERVNQDPAVLDDFVVKALGFTLGDPVFISDMSSLEDFGDEDHVRVIKDRILKHYGVEVKPDDSTLIADILVRVRAQI